MKKDLGLYLHVPFCVKKCNYCDFLSKEATEEEKEAYVDALIKEIKSYMKFAKEFLKINDEQKKAKHMM